jgi:hypothetical protein
MSYCVVSGVGGLMSYCVVCVLLYLYGSLPTVVCSVGKTRTSTTQHKQHNTTSPPTLQTAGGKDRYKYNTTQTTQKDMSPPTLQTTGGTYP